MSLCTIHIEDRVAHIHLNRPEKRNALSPELVSDLKLALENCRDNDEVKVVLLSGKGEAFCAGADLAYLQSLQNNSYAENLEDSMHLKSLFELMHLFPKIIVGKINGHAIAGGCGLASACDLVYSSSMAKFAYTEVRIGFIPAIVAAFLVRKCGESIAKDLLLSGRLIDAHEALNLNLINGVFAPEDLDAGVQKVTSSLVHKCSGNSLNATKELINMVQKQPLLDALNSAAKMNAKSRASDDCKKGISAFLNKEKVIW